MDERILQAAIDVAAVHGIGRLSVADVARRAGISRPTLYKHFPSKDALVAAAVHREASAIVQAVVDDAAAIADPRQALEASVLASLRLAREHPLLDRVVRTEPHLLVPLLTTDHGLVVAVVRGPVEAVIADRFPALDATTSRRLADMIFRLLVSYTLSSPDDPPEVVAAAMAGLLVDGALAAEAAAAAPTPTAAAPAASDL
jgi:AcrR family transcriptional regulator